MMSSRWFFASLCLGALLCGAAPAAAELNRQQGLEKFYSLHAEAYTYQASVTASGQPPQSGDVEVDYFKGLRVSSKVLNNGSANLGLYTESIETMFRKIYEGSASATGYNAEYGYPTTYSVAGPSEPRAVRITSFTRTLSDEDLDDKTDMNLAAEAKWKQKGWRSYHFRFQQSCAGFCSNPDPLNPSRTAPVIVNVHDGAVTNLLNASTLQPMAVAFVSPIAEMFLQIHIAIDTTDQRFFNASYDATLGFPSFFANRPYLASENAPSRYITEVSEMEVEPQSDSVPKWVFPVIVVLLILVIAVIVIVVVVKYRQRASSSRGGARPTDRAAAEAEEQAEEARRQTYEQHRAPKHGRSAVASDAPVPDDGGFNSYEMRPGPADTAGRGDASASYGEEKTLYKV
jgi:hypothetical protein